MTIRRILVLALTLLTLGVAPVANAAAPTSKPVVAVVAPSSPAVDAAIFAWSTKGSPVTLVQAPSCDGYAHCIVTTLSPYLYETTGNFGIVHGDVGDAIRGTCQVEVTMLDSRLLAHEYGHCLGLFHTTTDTKSIVYIGRSGPYTGNNTPDRRDYSNARAAWALAA